VEIFGDGILALAPSSQCVGENFGLHTWDEFLKCDIIQVGYYIGGCG